MLLVWAPSCWLVCVPGCLEVIHVYLLGWKNKDNMRTDVIKRTLVPEGTLAHKTKVVLTQYGREGAMAGLEVRAEQKQNSAIKPAFYKDLALVV